MNNFKRYTTNPSPYTRIQNKTDLMTKNKMTLEEAVKSKLGTITITAEVLEDSDTIRELQVSNIVAFLCKISVNGRVIAIGRGSSIITPSFKIIERVVGSACSSALIDGFVRSARSIESLNLATRLPNSNPPELKARYEEPESEPATEKQINYLRQLITINESDEDVRENKLSTLETITKEEASSWIESYRQ